MNNENFNLPDSTKNYSQVILQSGSNTIIFRFFFVDKTNYIFSTKKCKIVIKNKEDNLRNSLKIFQ